MDIILHRAQGSTKDPHHDWNDILESGFGIEIDVRDFNGEIVICHDPPKKIDKYPSLESLLIAYQLSESKASIAINIKSCGLSAQLSYLLSKYKINNYFCFDMAVPDCLNYERDQLIWFSRVSEYEPLAAKPVEMSKGIWLDSFQEKWFDTEYVAELLKKGTSVCLVADELHGRNHQTTIDFVTSLSLISSLEYFSVCTDVPELYSNLQIS